MKLVSKMVTGKGNSPELIIGVDLSWILHKNYSAIKVTAVVDGEEIKTGHYFGTVRLALSLTKQYPNAVIVFCNDSDPVGNKALLQEYKAGRERKFDREKASVEVSRIVSSIPGVYAAVAKGKEADEVMHSITRTYPEVDHIILSGDNDMLQSSVGADNVRIARKLTVAKKEFVTKAYVDKTFGVPWDEILLYRVLAGDKSDNIPGIYKPALCKGIASQYKTVEKYLESEPPESITVRRNYDLMELKKIPFNVYKNDVPNSLVYARKYRLNSFIQAMGTGSTGVTRGF